MTRDNRIGLKNNTIIHFGNKNSGEGKDVQITGEIGRGASCIVYDAIYLDNIGVQHKVRVKECYPSHLPIHRDQENQLIPSEYNRDKFVIAKKKFVDAYKQSAKIRNTLGLINSTINSTDTTSCNNTIYIKMELDEGSDYGKYEDGSLKSLFVHMKSLAQLIQKYHQNGYLYLDIKPENIFILPETDEHIILFDFDSVVTLEELAGNNRIELSFSKGFSPPEQIQGRRDKIGKHTDIYSIGALTFYKLFNRVATSQECNISATYPFGKMNYANEKYHPKLYRAINNFLRKTLSTATIPRWHDMQPVIEALDELIRLSDIDGIYLLNSFQYDSAHFIGRNEEMEKIAEILSTNQLVFLSGIGGIGKTELAKQYANQYRDQYDTVTFSVFEKNIETLVCNEILIHKISQDEEESDTAYFERKIEILKQIATPRDLVIIDNFDVDSDEKLEILFRCPCKFIITTRMDFRDYNYKQIDVDRLRDPEDVLELFYTYNNKDYPGEENKAVERLVHYVDYHTMTVELIAKYLRNSEELPAELYGKFLQKEGTTNTEEINVKQRKDGKLNLKSVNNHLKILFDVSGFDAIEQEMIRSLSLLAGIRIEKSKFYQLCAVDDGENKLELLIRSGWVEYHAVSGKISLHQVIQDLVYKELAPNAENCPKIVEGMGRYVDSKAANKTKENIKYKIFETFMERLPGNNLFYAKLCLKYRKESKLDEAEKICLSYHKRKSYDLLQKIYMEKIRIIFDSKQQIDSINGLLDKAMFYCKKVSKKPDYIVKRYMKIGLEIECRLSYVCSSLQGWLPEIDSIYLKIIEIFDIVTENLPLTSYSATKKEGFYQEIQSFYSGKYYGTTYIGEKLSDLEKAYQYQELVDQLQKDIPKRSLPHTVCDMSARSLAREYEKEGKYEKAIEYYEKDCKKACEIKNSYEIDKDLYEESKRSIASIYFKTGNIDKGVPALEQIIDYNKKQNIYSGNVYTDLISILIALENFEKAEIYIRELLCHEEPIASPNKPYSVIYVLSAYYSLYSLEQNHNQKNVLWQKCLKYYEILGNYEIREELFDFIMEYLDKEEVNYETIIKILNRIAGPFGGEEGIRRKIIQHCIEKYSGRNDFKKYYALFLIKLAELTDVNSYVDLNSGQKNCEKAQKYYNKYGLKDEYIQSLIYKTKAELMVNDKDDKKIIEVKKLCNYKLLAEQQISNYNYNKDEQVNIWKDAILQYKCTHNYRMMAVCITQALKISNPMKFGAFNYHYRKLMRELLETYITIDDFDSAYLSIIELYDRIVKCLEEPDNPDNTVEKFWGNSVLDNEIVNYLDNELGGFLKDETLDLDGIIKWFNHIAKYFIQISKFDDAVRTYLVIIYFVLAIKINFKLLKYGNNIRKDITNLCTVINKLLNKKIPDNIADPLVDAKDGLLEYKDLCSVDANIYKSIITKISEKCQYQSIEFKK